MSAYVALPRARATQKRRKPPRPEFWRALAWVLWDLLFISIDTIGVLGVIFIGWLSAVCWPMQTFALVHFEWPRFRCELDRWRQDDDS